MSIKDDLIECEIEMLKNNIKIEHETIGKINEHIEIKKQKIRELRKKLL
jgi:hypothetical protein